MKFSRELMKGSAPFIILTALHRLKEAYGYELMKAIRNQSEEVFDFPDSTLYPILYRLEEKGLVQSQVKETPNKKSRRYYWLTEEGLNHLGVREKEMKSYLEGLRRFLPGHSLA